MLEVTTKNGTNPVTVTQGDVECGKIVSEFDNVRMDSSATAINKKKRHPTAGGKAESRCVAHHSSGLLQVHRQSH